MIGIDLVDGTVFAAHAPRLARLLRGGLLLFDKGHSSPLQLAVYLGRAQWFDRLNRPTLAAFDKVYDFVRMSDDKAIAPLGEAVLGEIALSLLLSPFWEVDATRGWSTCLGASDASADFGFGVCAAAVSPTFFDLLEKPRTGGIITFVFFAAPILATSERNARGRLYTFL